MGTTAFRDLVNWHCYGCGRLNDRGLQIRSAWEGDEVDCRWSPEPFHVGLLDRLQGGVLATVVICHASWTATATAHRDEGLEICEPLAFAYSTTSAHIDFLGPTPVDGRLTLRAVVLSMDRERAEVGCTVLVGDRETVRSRTEHARVPLAP